MTIRMENWEQLTLAEMEAFVENNRRMRYTAKTQAVAYGIIEGVLKAQGYRRLSKGQKGIVRRYLAKVTGLSRAQVTRLLQRWMTRKRLTVERAPRRKFARRYTAADVALLAAVDSAHEDLSGPAVRRILQREYQIYGHQEYERLAEISASHIYNLRNTAAYRKQRVRVHQTQARKVGIGERRKPNPRGQPGWLRVDTVHQGDSDGRPGVYHINAVDTVTQWEMVGATETISERHLIPVLEAILHQFPFRIQGFHSDNGSEFINHTVAQLLEKLLVEFTKSRAYRTTDNAQVEGKNGAVVRKQIGYDAIAAEHADALQKFYTAHLNPYLNYHRPCGFATVVVRGRGKRRRVYRAEDYRTPYEKLISLPGYEQYLKPGISAAYLASQARRMSDTEAARSMQKAKLTVLAQCRRKV
jgi:transposase InsO family protein